MRGAGVNVAGLAGVVLIGVGGVGASQHAVGWRGGSTGRDVGCRGCGGVACAGLLVRHEVGVSLALLGVGGRVEGETVCGLGAG